MGHVIAISGKGGVGKTTLCGLLIQYLCESGKRPVLAVDADANANLNEVLGVEPEITLGELREEIERAGVDPRYQIPSGMTKQAYLEMRLSDAIAEEDDYDLMVMGRTQGQGCYCFVIIPPIITPMNEDESFNEAEFRNQIERQIEGGVHGIFCYGTNGECYALNTQEKEKILKVAVDQIKGRVPVYAGTGCITTKETVEMSKRAEALGADILSVITPYFAAVSQDELYEHYKTVAEAVKIPIVLYNIPARTGCSIAPETVAKLAEIDNIVGAKDSSGNWDNLKAYIELTRDKDFAVISGNDSLILSALKEGGVGGIAGCANVYPHNMVAIYEKFKAGDLEGAQAAQDAIASFRACFKYGNPNTIVKTAVGLLGYPVGKCRKPFYSMSEEGVAALKAVLEENKRNGMN